MRNFFSNQLKDLNIKLIKMGAMVQDIISESLKALMTQDLELARKVYDMDDEIDKIELEIEMECMKLIALQQPMARDLRVIGTIMKMITDLERMGDHAVNIAKTTLEIGKEPFIKPLIDLPEMGKLTEAMLKKSLDAFMDLDVDLAKEVIEDDEKVDELYQKIYIDLTSKMIEEHTLIHQATSLIFIGRFLERIADHATNIGERVIYMVTGENVSGN